MPARTAHFCLMPWGDPGTRVIAQGGRATARRALGETPDKYGRAPTPEEGVSEPRQEHSTKGGTTNDNQERAAINKTGRR